MLLALPPKEVQIRSAQYLNAKCTEIDTILSKTRSSIEEYKKLKQAVITQAVTKGVRGEREMKDSGVEWIGEIPKEWGRTKIKMIASFFNGDRTSRYPQPSDFVDAGVAFLTSRNIDSDEVDLSETKYITDDKYKSISGAKIQIDDIIFCLRGSVGKCAINRTLSCGTVASSLATIRPKDIYPKYLLYFLLSNIASTQTTIFMNGTCAANLSAENVGNYYITLPISTEQKEIADYLDAKCAEIDKLIAKKEQLVKEMESYKKSLIYEVATGKREV
jgi:type I restriction enzyme S subunit